jgi:hyaluronan synthase
MKKGMSSSQVLSLKPFGKASWDFVEPAFRFVILMFGVLILIFAMQKELLFNWNPSTVRMESGFLLNGLMFLSAIIFVFSLVFRTYLWFRYRPYNSAGISEWPDVTVMVPAYNEGETIFKTICSIAKCDYPYGRLNIISIDDGSGDDTFFHMERAREKHPDLVETIRFEKNQGKRRALHAGFCRNHSPFVVTIDSDTVLFPDSLKEILTPMLTNQKIGAVVGRIKVWNSNQNILTKMLNAHFAMAFDFSRAVQSTFNNVFCLAGAFAAYRKSILDEVTDSWLNQKFLGKPCTYGEDRSLTNYILKSGNGTFFQRGAVAMTMVPTSLGKILKMLTRWARSNIRESIIFSKILLNPVMKGKRTLPFIEFFSTYSLMVLHLICFYMFLAKGLVNSDFIIRFLAYSILFGFFYTLYYLRIEGKRDFPYLIAFSVFCSIFMVLIFTVAGFSLTKKSWATR